MASRYAERFVFWTRNVSAVACRYAWSSSVYSNFRPPFFPLSMILSILLIIYGACFFFPLGRNYCKIWISSGAFKAAHHCSSRGMFVFVFLLKRIYLYMCPRLDICRIYEKTEQLQYALGFAPIINFKCKSYVFLPVKLFRTPTLALILETFSDPLFLHSRHLLKIIPTPQ